MGSGVLRAIGIAAAVLVYAAGLILVDEIEDGIYYKRLSDFWKMLYEMAKRSDVQIIATTHSAECVSAAMEAITPDLKDADPLHIYKLMRGRRSPIPYEKESLKSAVEFMAELR
jgi:ABC-type lipoprotein export system ATPase subunit